MQHHRNHRVANRHTLIVAFGLFLSVGSTGVLWAQSAKGPIDVQLKAFKIVSKGDKDELEAADKIKPGETIEYQALYANTGKRAVKNLMATVPIPAGMEFVNGSTQPDGAQASADGKTFADIPLKRVSKGANGSTKVELVPLSQYRALRWNIGELGAGKTASVSARTRVLGPVKSTTQSTTKATIVGKEAPR